MKCKALENHVHSVEDTQDFSGSPEKWLCSKASEYNLRWMLSSLDDGFCWGIIDGNKLETSFDAFPDDSAAFRKETLQWLRLFGPDGELFLWKIENGFAARLILDGAAKPAYKDGFEDTYWGWGTGSKQNKKFTLFEEGSEFRSHAAPIADGSGKRPAIVVRHYVGYDDQGQAAVVLNRLVSLNVLNEGK